MQIDFKCYFWGIELENLLTVKPIETTDRGAVKNQCYRLKFFERKTKEKKPYKSKHLKARKHWVFYHFRAEIKVLTKSLNKHSSFSPVYKSGKWHIRKVWCIRSLKSFSDHTHFFTNSSKYKVNGTPKVALLMFSAKSSF